MPRHKVRRRRRLRPLRLLVVLAFVILLLALLLRPTLPSVHAASQAPALARAVLRAVPSQVRVLRQHGLPLVVSLGSGPAPVAALMDASVKGAAPRIYPLTLSWSGGEIASLKIGAPLAEAAGAADYGLGATGGFAYYATAVAGQFQTVSLTRGTASRWLFALSAPGSTVGLTPSGTRLWVAYLVHGSWRQGAIRLSQVGPRSTSSALVAVSAAAPDGNSFFIRIVESVRQHFGNGIVAAIENAYYNLADSVQRVYYHATGRRAGTPHLAVVPHESVSGAVARVALPGNIVLPQGWPAAAGEGVWQPVGPLVGGHPSMEETFLHPDPARPWATAYLVWIDPRALRLHYQTGLSEPVTASGIHGTGLLPTDPAQASHVVAAFNSGFKSESTAFGAMLDGEMLDPPVPGVATFAMYRNGQVALGTWGSASVASQGLESFRQNLPLIVDQGASSPLLSNSKAWGVVVGNSTYVWRSGLGIMPSGALVYVAGDPLSAFTLANTFVAAGAVRAMQLDINSYWVTFNFYRWVSQGSGGYLTGTKLAPALQRPASRYLTQDTRDFFYLTTP